MNISIHPNEVRLLEVDGQAVRARDVSKREGEGKAHMKAIAEQVVRHTDFLSQYGPEAYLGAFAP